MFSYLAGNDSVTLAALVTAFIFAFGCIIGSFLNAVLWRLRTGESVAHGRSYCPHCRHQLSVADLVPVLSFALLRGKCRYCRKGIHPSYVLVELAVGALFVAAAYALVTPEEFALLGISARTFARLLEHWYAIAILTVVFVFDLRYMLIPRSVTLPATIILAAAELALGTEPWRVVLGAVVGAGFFWVQYVLSRGKWIGGGDIHLGALMGVLLGWPNVVAALFMAYIAGAVFGVALLAGKRAQWGGAIPFGTFLSAGAAVTLLWGDRLVAWYLRLAL